MSERTIEQIRGVSPDSILAMLTSQADDFTTWEGITRWVTRRYDKLALPVILLMSVVTIMAYQVFQDPTPFFGLTIGQIFAFGFFIFLILLLSMLLGSNFILTMKAGKGKGNYKFNLIFNGKRMNDIEIDVILKDHHRINRYTPRFKIFEEYVDSYGKLNLPSNFINENITVETSFESLEGDPIISELQTVVKDWKLDIPARLVPDKFKNEEQKKVKEDSKQYSAGQLVQRPAMNLDTLLVDPNTHQSVIQDINPLHEFLSGSKNIYVHVLDFHNEFEYKGKKYPGLIFLHEKKTLQEIFPDPCNAFCMVGWTFGDIPVVTTQFVEIDSYKNIPIFYPDITRDRLIKISTLGFHDDVLPSIETAYGSKNLIELEVALPLMQYVQFIEKRFATLDDNQKKMMRKELALADRALGVWKQLHYKKEEKNWLVPLVVGFLLCLVMYPYFQYIFSLFANFFG